MNFLLKNIIDFKTQKNINPLCVDAFDIDLNTENFKNEFCNKIRSEYFLRMNQIQWTVISKTFNLSDMFLNTLNNINNSNDIPNNFYTEMLKFTNLPTELEIKKKGSKHLHSMMNSLSKSSLLSKLSNDFSLIIEKWNNGEDIYIDLVDIKSQIKNKEQLSGFKSDYLNFLSMDINEIVNPYTYIQIVVTFFKIISNEN